LRCYDFNAAMSWPDILAGYQGRIKSRLREVPPWRGDIVEKPLEKVIGMAR
jgi:hypothetical protein